MKAIKIVSKGVAEIQDVPIPKLRDGYVLVKVKAVALNPTDWKHIDYMATPGATVGCDYVGIIEAVGDKVDVPWKKGDRVAGFTHGANEVEPEDGCFAEYSMARAGVGAKVPDSMTNEDAATLGVGITTVGQSLYQSLGLPLPGSGMKAGFPILIYGGSSATGTLAIQYARLSGCSPIITTCSPRNFDLVKSLGADAVFDYHDPDCVQKIREYTNGTLMHVLDCIANGPTIDICSAALSTGGKVAYLLSSAKHTREDVQPSHPLAYTAMGEYFRFSVAKKEYPARPEDYEFGKMFWALSEKLIANGQIRPHPAQVGGGGLKGVFDGLQAMREGKVSGAKLVYRIEETP